MTQLSSGKKLFKAHQQSLNCFYKNNIESVLFDEYQTLILNRIHSRSNSYIRTGTIYFVSCGKTLTICNKISNMLNSLDVSSRSLNANECLHGDIGSIDCLNPNNVVIFVSMTGGTPEVIKCVETLLQKIKVLQLTKENSPLFLTMTKENNSMLHNIVDPVGVSIPLNYEGVTKDEDIFHNVKAPTLSLQLLYLFMDCLFVEIIEKIGDKDELNKKFSMNHPGGGLSIK